MRAPNPTIVTLLAAIGFVLPLPATAADFTGVRHSTAGRSCACWS